MKFELTGKQMKDLQAWREKIIELHDSVGQEQFIFTPTGMGDACVVRNISCEIELDISHQEDW